MGLSEWLLIIKGVLAFPKEVAQLIKLLQKTPVQKKDEIMKKIQEEAKSLEAEGRPKWDV